MNQAALSCLTILPDVKQLCLSVIYTAIRFKKCLICALSPPVSPVHHPVCIRGMHVVAIVVVEQATAPTA